MTPEDLAAIRARLDAATDGPWHGEHDEFGCVTIGDFGWVASGLNVPEYDVDSDQGKADAELIAHAPADLAALLDEVDRLTAERDEHAAESEKRRRYLLDTLQREDAARAALAAFRADVEALIVTEYDTASDEAHGTNPRRPFINPDDLAALLAKHAEEDA